MSSRFSKSNPLPRAVGSVLLGLLVLACGPGTPTRGPIPRRPVQPGSVSPKPPPRPQYSGVGPHRVAAKPGVDLTREPLTSAITLEMDDDEAMALRLAERARQELDDGTTTRALELLDAAIDKEPDSVPPYVIRAQAFLIEGDTSRARDDLQEAVDLEPRPHWLAEIVAVNGSILEHEGNRDGAIAAYRRALQISSANVTARDALRRLSSQ